MEASDDLRSLCGFVRDNPASRAYCYAALSHARERIHFDDLAVVLDDTPAPATCALQPRNVIANLLKKGALEQTIVVDGEPYSGAYDDFVQDESIDPEAKVQYFVNITDAGAALLQEISPENRVRALFASKPSYVEGFVAVLDLCSSEVDGVAKARIEAMVRSLACASGRAGSPMVSPAFYTTNLEDAGALVWRAGKWSVTDAGRAVLAQWNEQRREGRKGRR